MIRDSDVYPRHVYRRRKPSWLTVGLAIGLVTALYWFQGPADAPWKNPPVVPKRTDVAAQAGKKSRPSADRPSADRQSAERQSADRQSTAAGTASGAKAPGDAPSSGDGGPSIGDRPSSGDRAFDGAGATGGEPNANQAAPAAASDGPETKADVPANADPVVAAPPDVGESAPAGESASASESAPAGESSTKGEPRSTALSTSQSSSPTSTFGLVGDRAKDGRYSPIVPNVVIRDLAGKVVYRGEIDLRETLKRIDAGTKLGFPNDGSVFQNREQLLPKKNAGYYREWVHRTPGLAGPGPQRVVTGASREAYYTPDHYSTFRRVR
jgi:guanyl-specific ribonuclease Sa